MTSKKLTWPWEKATPESVLWRELLAVTHVVAVKKGLPIGSLFSWSASRLFVAYRRAGCHTDESMPAGTDLCSRQWVDAALHQNRLASRKMAVPHIIIATRPSSQRHSVAEPRRRPSQNTATPNITNHTVEPTAAPSPNTVLPGVP